MKKYYVNHRCSDGAVFIAPTKIMRKECVCLGSLMAKDTDKPATGRLQIGDVGFDIRGNKIEILSIKPII